MPSCALKPGFECSDPSKFRAVTPCPGCPSLNLDLTYPVEGRQTTPVKTPYPDVLNHPVIENGSRLSPEVKSEPDRYGSALLYTRLNLDLTERVKFAVVPRRRDAL